MRYDFEILTGVEMRIQVYLYAFENRDVYKRKVLILPLLQIYTESISVENLRCFSHFCFHNKGINSVIAHKRYLCSGINSILIFYI